MTIQHADNNWSATLDFSGYTLHPGGRVPSSSGEIFAVHYSEK